MMSDRRQDLAAADETQFIIRTVPKKPVLCIEHPGVVKNSHYAIKTLGGDYMLDKVR